MPTSDQTTFSLYHAVGHLTITAVIDDPIYLSEPHILSRTGNGPDCRDAPTPDPYYSGGRGPAGGEGAVATCCREESLSMRSRIYNIPREAVMGGAHHVSMPERPERE